MDIVNQLKHHVFCRAEIFYHDYCKEIKSGSYTTQLVRYIGISQNRFTSMLYQLKELLR